MENWHVHLQLAQVLAALGQQTDALSEYRRVIGAGPEDAPPDVLAAGMLSPIVAPARCVLLTFCARAAAVVAARISRDAGHFRESDRLLAHAMILHPGWRNERESSLECVARKVLGRKSDFYWAHYQYAECVGRSEQGDTYDGTHAQVSALTRATKLKPDWALAYNDMGLRFGYWQRRGKLQASVKHLSHAVGLDPASGIYATNLAMAYQHMGQLAKAASFSRRAATLQPDNAQVQVQLGRGRSPRNHPPVCVLASRTSLISEP